MAGESPGGGTVQTGGGEGVEAQLRSAGVDVVGNGLQGLKVRDLVEAVAGLLQQRLVDDDAERLVAVADGDELVAVIQVEVVGGELLDKVGVLQIQRVFAPGLDGALVADLEHGGSGVLIHFRGQGVVVFAGRGGDDLNGHAGLLGVGLGKILPGLVGFGLEVQVIDLAVRRGLHIGGLAGIIGLVAALAGREDEDHDKRQCECDEFLHENASFR